MAAKAMSEAYKKAQAVRDEWNKGRACWLAKDLSCVVYVWTGPQGKPCAKGYIGRALKPNFQYYYSSAEKRAQSVREWMETVSANSGNRRKAKPRALEVGDVLSATWGYDQTNVDYFLVTALIGKTMVELVEIGADSIETGWMQGQCVPNPEFIKGKSMRRKADGECVSVDDVRRAYKIEAKEIAGCKIYSPSSWSAYH